MRRVPRGFGPDLPGSLVLAALLVAVVVSRVSAAHRVSDAVGALYSAAAAWTIEAEGATPSSTIGEMVDSSQSCPVQHPFGQLELALPGIEGLTPEEALVLELWQVDDVMSPAGIELQMRLEDVRTLRERTWRAIQIENVWSGIPVSAPYWSTSGGDEVIWLMEDAVAAYVAGAPVATLTCCHAACERELAGCLSMSQIRFGDLPKSWERWGLGPLNVEARKRGIVSIGLHGDLVKMNDNRRSTAHFKHPLEPTSIRNRAFAKGGPDARVPVSAIEDLMYADALAAYRTAFRLLRGRGEGFDSFDSLLPQAPLSGSAAQSNAGGGPPGAER